MLGKSDQRIVELKLLENLAEGTWGDGVCTSVGVTSSRKTLPK